MDSDNAVIDGAMREVLTRNVHRYAVSRAISCACGSVLDVRRAVTGEIGGRPFVSCAKCWDAVGMSRIDVARSIGLSVDVVDGRVLYPATETRPRVRNPVRKAEVKVGSTYDARVSGKLTRVRIVSTRLRGGWVARNVATGREVIIKTAARLRGESR